MKLTLHLEVQDPVKLNGEEGVLKTTLTHPQLEGELYFLHSSKGSAARDAVIASLDENPFSSVLGVATLLKGVIHRDTTTTSPGKQGPRV